MADGSSNALFIDDEGYVTTFAVPFSGSPVPVSMSPVTTEKRGEETATALASGSTSVTASEDVCDTAGNTSGAAARAFYKKHGFVVFREVFSQEVRVCVCVCVFSPVPNPASDNVPIDVTLSATIDTEHLHCPPPSFTLSFFIYRNVSSLAMPCGI